MVDFGPPPAKLKEKKGKKRKKGKKKNRKQQKQQKREAVTITPTLEDLDDAVEIGVAPNEDWPRDEIAVDEIIEELEEPKDELPPEVVNGLTLIVGPDDGVIDNADVRVRWCVTPELTKHLIDKGVENPHIVLSTCDPKTGKHEWRGVFPLNQVITYARFYMAGTMNLYACIVDMEHDATLRKKTMLKWTQHDYDSYNHQLQSDGNYFRTIGNNEDIHATTTEAVIIPAGVFQKEPPKWLDWFVNLWHGQHKNEDGCEFRRRAALAFTLKWIPMFLWTIIHTVAMGLLYLGYKGLGMGKHIVNTYPIFHPFAGVSTSMLSAKEGEWGDIRDSKYLFWINWNKDVNQPLFTMLGLSPAWVSLLAIISLGVAWGEHGHLGLDLHSAHENLIGITLFFLTVLFMWDVSMAIGTAFLLYVMKDDCQNYLGDDEYGPAHVDMGKAGLVTFVIMFLTLAGWNALPWQIFIAIVIAASIIGVLITFINLPIFDRWWNAFNRWTDRVYDKLYQLFGSPDDYTEMRELLCPKDKQNLSTDINSLPGSNVAWRLKFRDLKAMVCKPRQRR